jgi:hypothetical protein
MRHRQAVAEARQVRRLHRLLELSRMQLHPPASARSRWQWRSGGGRRATSCSARTRTRPRRSRCARPLRPLCPARRRQGSQALQPAQGLDAGSIDHEKALALLALPRDVGKHPESGKMISAGIGRYGPFVLHDGTYANLERIEDVFSIGLNRAVSVIAEKRQGPAAAVAARRPRLKDLGEHPDGGGKITVRDGRYGPYVNFGKVNATLPKGKDPQSSRWRKRCADRRARGQGRRQEAGAEGAGQARPQGAKSAKTAAKPKAKAKPKAAGQGKESRIKVSWPAASPAVTGIQAGAARPVPAAGKRRHRDDFRPTRERSCLPSSPKIPIGRQARDRQGLRPQGRGSASG